MKRIISVLLAAAMFLSFPLTASAEPSEQQQIDAVVKEIFRQIKPEMTDFEKTVILYDWITRNVWYDWNGYYGNSPKKVSVYNALVEKSAVCSGFARAFEFLLNEAGITNRLISGRADGYGGWGGHAWNLVKINGSWYHVDTTWGTAERYTYFLLSDEVMSERHDWHRASIPATPIDSFIPFSGVDENRMSIGFRLIGNSAVTFDGSRIHIYNIITCQSTTLEADNGIGGAFGRTNFHIEGDSIFFINADRLQKHNITTGQTTTLMTSTPGAVLRVEGDYFYYRAGLYDDRTAAFFDPLTEQIFPVPTDLLSSTISSGNPEPLAVHGDLAFFFERKNNITRLDTSSWTYDSWGIRIYDYITDPDSNNITLNTFNIKTGETEAHVLKDNDSHTLSFAGIRNNKAYFYSRADLYRFNINTNSFTRLPRPADMVVDEDRTVTAGELVYKDGKVFFKWSTLGSSEPRIRTGMIDITSCDCCPSTQDALQILRYVAGVSPLTDEMRIKYDLGDVGTSDALDILKLIAGIR
ncbi:MAG: hypothetical protein FWE74_10645 [Oscillospiraceae bacterium]|nr:hypothetical protein [Oscillospiraceae bacterium]